MYTSIIEMDLKPGSIQEATEIGKQMRPDLEQVDGIRQFIVIDKGNDTCLVLAIYDREDQQQAAGPKAQELLGRLGHLFAATPARQGGEVVINESF